MTYVRPETVAAQFHVRLEGLEEVRRVSRVRIPQYYAELIQRVDDPIWKQCMPSCEELKDDGLPLDALGEEGLSPVPHLTHKYPDRVLLLLTDRCPMYCRFCTRKRKTHAKQSSVTQKTVEAGLKYIAQNTGIREVILSGGEPLVAPLKRLQFVLKTLKGFSHVKWIRVHTKLPCVDPDSLTAELASVLGAASPLYVHVHFNHPREVTPQAMAACQRLIDQGIPLGSQTVLLKGVNDDAEILKDLFEKLVAHRIRPYYLLIADPCHGTQHFRTTVQEALKIFERLRGWCSGMMIPHLILEGPEGKGKIPILPKYLKEVSDQTVVYHSYDGTELRYS